MTREETIYELGEWLEQMIQHGVPSHSTKRKALAYAIQALSADRPMGEWTNEDGKPITDKFCVYCSKCKEWSEYRTNYCGHCGARMR